MGRLSLPDLKMEKQPKANAITSVERIESRILLVRGHKVILDSDLA
jgi:hypothetical protein